EDDEGRGHTGDLRSFRLHQGPAVDAGGREVARADIAAGADDARLHGRVGVERAGRQRGRGALRILGEEINSIMGEEINSAVIPAKRCAASREAGPMTHRTCKQALSVPIDGSRLSLRSAGM